MTHFGNGPNWAQLPMNILRFVKLVPLNIYELHFYKINMVFVHDLSIFDRK